MSGEPQHAIVRRFFTALEAKNIDAALDCLASNVRLETASRVEHGHISIRIPLRMLLDYGFASSPQLTHRPSDNAILAAVITPLGPITAQIFVEESGLIANIIAV